MQYLDDYFPKMPFFLLFDEVSHRSTFELAAQLTRKRVIGGLGHEKVYFIFITGPSPYRLIFVIARPFGGFVFLS